MGGSDWPRGDLAMRRMDRAANHIGHALVGDPGDRRSEERLERSRGIGAGPMVDLRQAPGFAFRFALLMAVAARSQIVPTLRFVSRFPGSARASLLLMRLRWSRRPVCG